ncbi:hypothetical protein Scep_014847 [Stephania cephalantha]|uniref:Uncharacterized protein n=1 Tax=Stephania cephalantha TaxID=152367 RepID=A0AAP0J4M0_9MAGN
MVVDIAAYHIQEMAALKGVYNLFDHGWDCRLEMFTRHYTLLERLQNNVVVTLKNILFSLVRFNSSLPVRSILLFNQCSDGDSFDSFCFLAS